MTSNAPTVVPRSSPPREAARGLDGDPGGGPRRRTQQERSAATRELLMNATLDCLIECGYARTTTTGVAERAGVSRGAQLHHFPTKANLVISAVAHLAACRRAQLVEEARALPTGGERTDQLLELVWSSFSGPLFLASLELWVAARTDLELRESLIPFERGMGRAMAELWHELAGSAPASAEPGGGPASEANDVFDAALDLTVHLLRGMALQRILRDDDTARRRLFETWKGLMRQMLGRDGSEGARERRARVDR